MVSCKLASLLLESVLIRKNWIKKIIISLGKLSENTAGINSDLIHTQFELKTWEDNSSE